MGKLIRIPPAADPEMQLALRGLEDALLKIGGTMNTDFHGRRIINAGSAINDGDYVTLLDVRALINKTLSGHASSVLAGAQGAAQSPPGGPGGGGGGGGLWVPAVPVPDPMPTMEAYDAAHPGQIDTSCGDWTYLDGIVAALQAEDERYGYVGQYGNPADVGEDVISYYCGELSVMVAGSFVCYVWDIIGRHCGVGPYLKADHITKIGTNGAAWLPTR